MWKTSKKWFLRVVSIHDGKWVKIYFEAEFLFFSDLESRSASMLNSLNIPL